MIGAPPASTIVRYGVLDGVHTAVTVGVGNVAIDVARMLVKTADDLSATDMPVPVLAELATHQITDVWVIGRRGPEHASFTTTELRELLTTPGVAVSVEGCDLGAVDDAVLDRRTRANVAALAEADGRSVPQPRAQLRRRRPGDRSRVRAQHRCPRLSRGPHRRRLLGAHLARASRPATSE